MKREDEQMTESGRREPEDFPEPAPERTSSTDVPSGGGAAAPRMARFGEGPEGRPARRERGEAGARDGIFERAGKFVRDVRSELGRVSWPSATEVRNTTIITIVAVIFFAVYLFVVDHALAKGIEGLQWLVNKIFGA
ncbi:MAG TPA: preprotein translocase subunit SecE [Pyrinomonadaceae bacterium]|nr:preprotein translocase subunit SecE [Pyrinomonadaceae bacterium]